MCTKTVLLWAKKIGFEYQEPGHSKDFSLADIDNLYGDYHIIAHNTEHFLTYGNRLRKDSRFNMEMT